MFAIALITVAPAFGAAAEKTWTIRFHYEQPPTAPLPVYGFEPWAKDVEKATKGRVKVQIYSGDTLFKTKSDAVESVKLGIADVAFLYSWAYSPQFDLTDVLGVPFIVPNAEVAGRVTWALLRKFPEMQNAVEGCEASDRLDHRPLCLYHDQKADQGSGRFQGDEDANDRGHGHGYDEAVGRRSCDVSNAGELSQPGQRGDRRHGGARRGHHRISTVRDCQILHHGANHVCVTAVDYE